MKEFSIFVEAMRRLYRDGNINEEKIILLFNDDKITEEEKNYILAL
jgi:hypothetical protein